MASPDPQSSPASGGSRVVGVLSLLTYLLGSLVISFTLHRTLTDLERPLSDALRPLGFGFAAVGGGLLLQLVRERGQAPKSEDEDDFSPWGWRAWAWPLGLILVPLVGAWIQFELFRPTVYMWPMPALIGGVWLGITMGHPAARWRYGSSVTMALIAVLTVPLALLSVALPSKHFREHGSRVVFLAGDEFEEREYPLPEELPQAPMRELSAMGPGTSELIGALADAKPVEGIMVDGVFHVQNEAGEYVPAQQGNLDEMFERAEKLDAAAEAEANAEYMKKLEAHQRQVDYLRRSGRIFTRPAPP